METYCDSDEEVFFGRVTLKEIRKALTLRRKTQVFENQALEHQVEEADSHLTPQPERHEPLNWRRASCAPKLLDSEETPAPPPSPEHIPYNGSPYPTPCHPRKQVLCSLAGITEDPGLPMQSTPINQNLRFSQFGDWRDSQAISYSSDVLSLSPSSECDSPLEDARDLLIAKMQQHQEQTERLRGTKKTPMDDSTEKPSRFSRLISERISPSPQVFLGELERRYGRERAAARPTSPEFDIKIPHAVVAGNYSLISDADEVSVQADEDGGYLSVLSEAALYHASLKPAEVPEQDLQNSCRELEDHKQGTSAVIGEKKQPEVVTIPDDSQTSLIGKEEFSGTAADSDYTLDSLTDKEVQKAADPDYSQDSLRDKLNHKVADPGYSQKSLGDKLNHKVADLNYSQNSLRDNLDQEVADYSQDSLKDKLNHKVADPGFSQESLGDKLNHKVADPGYSQESLGDKLNHKVADLNFSQNSLRNNLDQEVADYSQDSLADKLNHEVAEPDYSQYSLTNKVDQKEEPVIVTVPDDSQERLMNTIEDEHVSELSQTSLIISERGSCDGSINSDLYMESCQREMDALEDLNESDRKNLDSFHDTLEEIELLLNLGLDYDEDRKTGQLNLGTENDEDRKTGQLNLGSEYDEDRKTELLNMGSEYDEDKKTELLNLGPDFDEDRKTVCESDVAKLPPVSRIPHAIVSPMVQVKTKVEKQSPFKVPVKPPAQKKTPLKPVTTPPCKKMSQYDRIVSPVSAYIHTPSPSLVTNIKPRTPHPCAKKNKTHAAKLPSPPETLHRGRENVDTSNLQPILPVITYKSAPSVKLEQSPRERLPRLNDKLKKLVDTPRPRVIRHEGRVRVQASPAVLHYDDSCSDAEVSVVVGKRVSCTNTLGM